MKKKSLSAEFSENIAFTFGILPKLATICLIAGTFVYLLSGVYSIGTSEVGVHKRFGEIIEIAGPGIHFALPWPIDKIDKVKTGEAKTVEVGAWLSEADKRELSKNDQTLRVLHNRYYLTGDKNIVHVRMTLRYRENDPERVLYAFDNVIDVIRQLVSEAIIRNLARAKIDDVLTRPVYVQNKILADLSNRLSEIDAGVEVQGLELTQPHPPRETAEAFNEVINAQEDKKSSINEATGYYNEVIPSADAEASSIKQNAIAKANEIIRESEAKADKFNALLKEYKKEKSSTKARLYLEMAEKVFPAIKKTIINKKTKGKIKLLIK